MDKKSLATSSHTSLNKAANLLGVNELNKLDYKSLNSIRKLAKTFGCNEYDLMKTFASSGNEELTASKSSLASSHEPSQQPKETKSKTNNLKPNKTKTIESIIKSSRSSTKQTSKQITNEAASSQVQTPLENFKIDESSNPSQTESVKHDKVIDKSPSESLSKKSVKSASSTIGLAKKSSFSVRKRKTSISKYSTLEKSYSSSTKKLVISDKLYKIANKKLATTKSSATPSVAETQPVKQSLNLNQIISSINQKREVTLYKDENLGFGFIAGSEKPLVIRFVTPDGPGKNKLLNGDEILSINDEDVQFASRDYVINLIRNSNDKIKLCVKQPIPKSNNSLLLTEDKKAIKKINQGKNKVRFCLSEGVKKLTPSSSSSSSEQSFTESELKQIRNAADDELSFLDENEDDYNEICIESDEKKTTQSDPSPSPNRIGILKVYLENKSTKTFKYDSATCVRDVLTSLKARLDLKLIEHFGLVIKNKGENAVSKLIFLDENLLLYKIDEYYEKKCPTKSKKQNSDCHETDSSAENDNETTSDYDCLFRFVFIPTSYENLLSQDINAFNYLYEQCINDVLNDRFGNELKYEIALHLATLSILHDHINFMSTSQLQLLLANYSLLFPFDTNSEHSSSTETDEEIARVNKSLINFNFIDESTLEHYLPKSLLVSDTIKPKDLKRILMQNLNWFLQRKHLNQNDIKLEYLKCMHELVQFSGRIFFANLLDIDKDLFVIIGSNFGIATLIDIKSKIFLRLAKFESIENIRVSPLTPFVVRIDLDLLEIQSESEILNKTLSFGFSKNDYIQFLFMLQGYLRINAYPIKKRLCPIQEIRSGSAESLNLPVFFVKYPTCKSIEPSSVAVSEKQEAESAKPSNIEPQLTNSFNLEELDMIIGGEMKDEQLADSNSFEQKVEILREQVKVFNNDYDMKKKVHDELYERFNSLKLNEAIQTTIEDEASSEQETTYELMLRGTETWATQNSSGDNIDHEYEVNYKIVKSSNSSISHEESLPLIESIQINNRQEENVIHHEAQAKAKDSDMSSESDLKSLSSIEGSLRGMQIDIINGGNNHAQICSSTPLTHLYPRLGQKSTSSNTVATTNQVSKHEEEETSDKQQKLWPSPPPVVLTTNYIYEFTRARFDEFPEKKMNQLESCVLDNAAYLKKLLGSSGRLNELTSGKKLFESEFNGLDVIDLTKLCSSSMFVPPPPAQFSDDFQSNERKLNECEIESGIDSDSSGGEPLCSDLMQQILSVSSPTRNTLLKSESDDSNNTEFSCSQTIKLENDDDDEDEEDEYELNSKTTNDTSSKNTKSKDNYNNNNEIPTLYSSKLVINLESESSTNEKPQTQFNNISHTDPNLATINNYIYENKTPNHLIKNNEMKDMSPMSFNPASDMKPGLGDSLFDFYETKISRSGQSKPEANKKTVGPMTDSALSFNTFISSSNSTSPPSSSSSSPKYAPIDEQSNLFKQIVRPVATSSASSSPAPSIIRVVNNANDELADYIHERARLTVRNDRFSILKQPKRKAVDMISEEIKLEKSELLENRMRESKSFLDSIYSNENIGRARSSGSLSNITNSTNQTSQNYFDLPVSFFPPSSVESSLNSEEKCSEQQLRSDSRCLKPTSNRSILKVGSVVDIKMPKSIVDVRSHDTTSSPTVKVNLPSNLRTDTKKNSSAPPRPPQPVVDSIVDTNTTKPVKSAGRSTSSVSFHRVLNRIVETGVHVTKSKLPHMNLQDNNSSPATTGDTMTRYEMINGYDPSSVPSNSQQTAQPTNGKKKNGENTLSKGLNKLKFYRKSYSVSSSLPSRNFNIKSLIDKLNTSSSSKAKVRLENSLSKDNVSDVSSTKVIDVPRTSDNNANSSIVYYTNSNGTLKETTNSTTTTTPFRKAYNAPPPPAPSSQSSIGRFKSFSIYNSSKPQQLQSDANISHLFSNSNGALVPRTAETINSGVVKLKTSKSFNFAETDLHSSLKKNKIVNIKTSNVEIIKPNPDLVKDTFKTDKHVSLITFKSKEASPIEEPSLLFAINDHISLKDNENNRNSSMGLTEREDQSSEQRFKQEKNEKIASYFTQNQETKLDLLKEIVETTNNDFIATFETTATLKENGHRMEEKQSQTTISQYKSQSVEFLNSTASPESPKKGALKKLGLRDASITRSALKVRWNDMIEITDVIDIGENRRGSIDSYRDNNNDDDEDEMENIELSDDDEDDEDDDLNDGLYDDDDEDNENDDNEEDCYGDDDESDEVSFKKNSKHENGDLDGKHIVIDKKMAHTGESASSSQEMKDVSEGTQTDMRKTSLVNCKVEQFNLKPLHSIGREFEKEMNARIDRLNAIKIKTFVDENTDKFFDEIHSDLDVVLLELHSTIEHVRLSSMMISNMKNNGVDAKSDNQHDVDSNKLIELNELNINATMRNNKISEIVANCRDFVNNSKTMISSALLMDESELKQHVRQAMNSICSLVVHCFESSFLYLYKNEKLDEIRQLLIQLLNLLNTFRVTLNITYLAAAKQLNEANIGMLMKQATSLANEISVLIKHFRLLL